jgi:hypothetical protein
MHEVLVLLINRGWPWGIPMPMGLGQLVPIAPILALRYE